MESLSWCLERGRKCRSRFQVLHYKNNSKAKLKTLRTGIHKQQKDSRRTEGQQKDRRTAEGQKDRRTAEGQQKDRRTAEGQKDNKRTEGQKDSRTAEGQKDSQEQWRRRRVMTRRNNIP